MVKPKSEKISNIPKKKQRGKKAKKEEKIQKTTILSLYKNYKFPAEIKEENNRQFPIPMDFEDSRSREQFIDLTNIPGTSEINFFQRMNEDSNHSNRSIKFEPQTPKTPARNTTMNPKAAALVEEYRNIDENSMDAMLAQIIDDPKEREALLKFSAVNVKPLVNHSKQQTTKSTKKTKGRPKKTPPKRGSVNQSTIAQMFKKAESKKSNK